MWNVGTINDLKQIETANFNIALIFSMNKPFPNRLGMSDIVKYKGSEL